MKRLLPLLLLSLLVLACESDIDRRSPFVQAEIDGSLFRSKSQIVVENEDSFILRASTVDLLNIKLSSVSPGVYEVGPGTNNQVTFQRDGQLFVSSGSGTGGVLEIERADSLSISGNFNFNLRQNGIGRLININKGVFYEIPFEPEEIFEIPGFEENVTENNFLDASVNGENFSAGRVTAQEIDEPSPSVEIIGLISTGEIIGMTLPISQGDTGTFNIDQEGVEAFYSGEFLDGNFESNLFAESGEIEITTYNEESIIGSFSFTTEAGDEVLEGEFEISVFE